MTARSRHGSLRIQLAAIVAGLLLVSSPSSPAHAAGIGPVQGGALPGPLPLFPADNWWNTDVSAAPVDPNSASFITFINNGGTRRLHRTSAARSPGSAQVYGMPYAVVDGTQPKVTVRFVAYPSESDGVGVPFYPIPTQAITQPHWWKAAIPETSTAVGRRIVTCSSWTATTSCSTSSITSTTTRPRADGRRTAAHSGT